MTGNLAKTHIFTLLHRTNPISYLIYFKVFLTICYLRLNARYARADELSFKNNVRKWENIYTKKYKKNINKQHYVVMHIAIAWQRFRPIRL